MNHLDESSSTGINGEAAWAGDTGESVVVLTLAGELQEDPALLLFPSRVSEDTHTPGSDSCATSEESMLVMPGKISLADIQFPFHIFFSMVQEHLV